MSDGAYSHVQTVKREVKKRKCCSELHSLRYVALIFCIHSDTHEKICEIAHGILFFSFNFVLKYFHVFHIYFNRLLRKFLRER